MKKKNILGNGNICDQNYKLPYLENRSRQSLEQEQDDDAIIT